MTVSNREIAFQQAADLLREWEPALAAALEFGCLKLHPGEPFFVLRGQDITSASIVEDWIRANSNQVNEHKIEQAGDVAVRMRTWAGIRKVAD